MAQPSLDKSFDATTMNKIKHVGKQGWDKIKAGSANVGTKAKTFAKKHRAALIASGVAGLGVGGAYAIGRQHGKNKAQSDG